MEKVNSNWKIWGIVAFVVIGFLFILLIGSYNAVMQLEEMYEDSFVCAYDQVGYCADKDEVPVVMEEGTVAVSEEDWEESIICPKNTEAVCMLPEDYKEIYG